MAWFSFLFSYFFQQHQTDKGFIETRRIFTIFFFLYIWRWQYTRKNFLYTRTTSTTDEILQDKTNVHYLIELKTFSSIISFYTRKLLKKISTKEIKIFKAIKANNLLVFLFLLIPFKLKYSARSLAYFNKFDKF